jgi:site-specific recombinase XerD
VRKGRDDLLASVQRYFQEHLPRVLGASHNTIRAYSDSLRLFFQFLADHVGRSISALGHDDIRADAVLAFLEHVEVKRRNAATTRNCRLAAIRSFVDHLLRHDMTRAGQYGRVLAIPSKRTRQRVVTYLEPEEARAVIAQTRLGPATSTSARDQALLLLLYNTGARVSEALAVRRQDLRLDRPRQVRFLGKGNKERVCPLWTETALVLRELVNARSSSDEPIFRSARGAVLTRDGAAYIVAKYVRSAAESSPHLRKRKVTPHVIRHSCAVALLQAGVDVTTIRDYLGHASIATTNRYLATNMELKRTVLTAFWKRAGLDRGGAPKWRASPKLIEFLESL